MTNRGWSVMHLLLLKALLSISTVVIINQTHLKEVGADLVVHPLWNIRPNSTVVPCAITSNGEARQTYIFNGHSSVICSLQITSTNDSAVLIQIPPDHLSTDVLYIERIDPGCTSERFVLIGGEAEPCTAVVSDKQFRIHIQGNRGLIIEEIYAQSNEPPDSCEDIGEPASSVPGTAPNCAIKKYDDVNSCNHVVSSIFCKLYLQDDCNNTIGYREVTTRCQDPNKDMKSLIIYSDNMTHLYLVDQNIVEIDVDAFKNLPNLLRLYLRNNHITRWTSGLFDGLHQLQHISIRNNPLGNLPSDLLHELPNLNNILLERTNITTLPIEIFKYTPKLNRVKLDDNHLKDLRVGLFRGLKLLTILDLSHNLLATLSTDLFQDLHLLETLLLQNNHLRRLDAPIFHNLGNLTALSVGFNMISHLGHELFQENVGLTFLDLSNNMLLKIPHVNHLTKLSNFHLEGNKLQTVSEGEFSNLHQIKEFTVSQPEICVCYTNDVNCSTDTPQSPYLTCDRLLSDRILELIIWLIGLSALIGNGFVLWWRSTNEAKYKVQSRIVFNLAMSDFLMGVYMIILASADIKFGNNFPLQAENWRTGIPCKIAGVLSIVSSEASVFFVTLISIDRFISIKYPSTSYKFGDKSIIVAISILWIFAFIFGIIPSVLSGKNPDFYDNSHVCIGIPLALVTSYTANNIEKTVSFNSRATTFVKKNLVTIQGIGSAPGMYFSTAVFIGLNSLCYLAILICYIQILRVVYRASQRGSLSGEMKKQLSLTAKVTAIVGTDFLCWCPIIVLGILVQSQVLTLPPSVFAWSVTFILPLNSAINPYLYTIADIINDRRKREKADQFVDSEKTRGIELRVRVPKDIQLPPAINADGRFGDL